MKFLTDQNIRYGVIEIMRQVGHDIIHTSEIGLSRHDGKTISLQLRQN